MGQKVHPCVMRFGSLNFWSSNWYSNNKDFANYLHQDYIIRSFLFRELKKSFVSNIVINRLIGIILITIYTARPIIIIGKNKGVYLNNIRLTIINMIGIPVKFNVVEVFKPELNSKLIANNISIQLERRILFRKIIKRAIQNAINYGVKGIKIELSGRLGGAEIARTEWQREGRVPLHTLRANIDFSSSIANTIYGIIGIKVWIFNGEIFDSNYRLNNLNNMNNNFVFK